MNLCSLHMLREGLRGKNVVNTPSYVTFARITPGAPPGIETVPFLEKPEVIHEPSLDDLIDALTLLVGESLHTHIGIRACQVIRRMSNIQVPTEDDGLLLLELLHVFKECWVPLLVSERQAREVILGVRGVDGNHPEVEHIGRHDPTLL